MIRTSTFVVLVVATLVLACDAPNSAPDTSPVDDAGPARDGAPSDGGPSDGGPSDAAPSDAAPSPDAGRIEARRVQAQQMVHVGSFAVPTGLHAGGSANAGFEYGGTAAAYDPVRNGIYLVGHDWDQFVGEISIPAIGGTATMLQPLGDVLGGKIETINPGDSNAKKIGGVWPMGNGKLLISAYAYYDAANTAVGSHFLRSDTLPGGAVTGPFRVGTVGVAFTAGYFGAIPAEWQAKLGGSVFNGQCCIPIISRTSFGPALFAIDPATVGTTNPAPAQPLVYYDQAHPTLGDWDSSGTDFNGTTSVVGVVMPKGSSTVLFFGRHGTGPFCYGGTECNDPEDSYKGTHAYPYESRVWAYDATDLAAVKAGTKKPWEPVPYATWKLPGTTATRLAGATYDPQSGRIYVSVPFEDGDNPRIHVYEIE